jgi:hypothetical protein
MGFKENDSGSLLSHHLNSTMLKALQIRFMTLYTTCLTTLSTNQMSLDTFKALFNNKNKENKI